MFTNDANLYHIRGFKYDWYFDTIDKWVYQEIHEGGCYADLKPVFRASDAYDALCGVEARDNDTGFYYPGRRIDR
jgi:hypothetical protein